MMQQLSLLDLPSEQLELKAAYDALHSHSLTFKVILASALVIEQELDNRAIYQELGFVDIKKFLESIPAARGQYVVAMKMIWWQRLIWNDRPIDWLTPEQFKTSNFIIRYSFIDFNKTTLALTLHKQKKHAAKITWQLITSKYGNDCSLFDIQRFLAYDGSCNEHIAALEAKVSQLTNDLELAKKGVISHHGKIAKNREVPLDYSELYCLALETDMTGIQLKCFFDYLILSGYKEAKSYVEQFTIIA
jgi:hypothetical protein